MRFRIACLALCSVAAVASQSLAQISAVEAQRMGLEIAWQSQAQLPRVGSGVVSSHLWVEPTKPRKFAVVELPDRRIKVSADKMDKYGVPIGIEEAKKQANEQAARLLGKTDGFEVVEMSVPRIRLVFVTNDGYVQTLDAETGKLLWASACGQSTAPAHPAAVSPAGVAVIHGEEFYLLDWETGKHRMEKQLRFSSANAVAVCNDVAFVSDFTGRVETYGLGRTMTPWSYIIQGRAVGQPVSLRDQSFCAIASNDGFVYVFTSGTLEPAVWIRYETASAINGSLAAGNAAFYAGSAGGLLSKFVVDDRLGRILWEFPVGQTITAPPLVIGNQVLAVTESGDALSIEDDKGEAAWFRSGLGLVQPIAKTAGKIFCTSLSNQIYALDAETGEVVASTAPFNMAKPIINQTDDRLYVLARNGRVQCLRPIGADLPTLVQPVEPVAEEASAPVQVQPTTESTNSNPFDFGAGGGTPANPFDAGNPFGGTGGNAGGMNDPFGGGAGDPFGGATGNDPFGGGNQP
jgi:outer membrane protein assembly factor BamB